MLSDLTEPVRRYLRYTGVIGKPFPIMVRLHQEGRMRTGAGQPWMPMDAEEHYSVQPPGFVWTGTVRLGPLAVARARDMYAEGAGQWANGRPPETGVHGPFKIRTSGMTSGYYRTSSPVTALRMIRR